MYTIWKIKNLGAGPGTETVNEYDLNGWVIFLFDELNNKWVIGDEDCDYVIAIWKRGQSQKTEVD